MEKIENYKISIIVPVYNTEKYLHECVDSLLKQTIKDIEIVLVNDGSNDKSGGICDLYAKTYENVKVLHQVNSGQSAARNAGIRKSSGQYVMFIDSDDYILPNSCAVLYDAALKYNADVVWADMLNDPRINVRKEAIIGSVETCRHYMARSLKTGTYDIVPWLKIIKKDFLIKNNLFFLENTFYEDQESTLKLLLVDDSRLIKILFPFYYYRENTSSTTHIHTLKKGLDCIRVIHQMIKDIDEVQLSREMRECAESVISMSVYQFSRVFEMMSEEDAKELKSFIDTSIRTYGKKTKYLPIRIKIQNRLFITSPMHFKRILGLAKSLRKVT